jgi:hypothetical protein
MRSGRKQHGAEAQSQRGHRPRAKGGFRLGLAVAAMFLAAGLALVLAGRGGHRSAPPALPPASRAGRAARGAAGPGRPVRPLGYSRPIQVAIPVIKVSAPVIPLGLTAAGTVEVPLLSQPGVVSWFDDGPAPGQRGPAALYGHVATALTGPAVFFRLSDLQAGDTVQVTSADDRVALFRVYRVAVFPKTSFPTREVYGPTPGAELRLITCGGAFNQGTGSYLDNVVAFARLSAVLRAPAS